MSIADKLTLIAENEQKVYNAGYKKGKAATAEITLQEKTVTENGEVTADEGYDGLSKVTVNVAGGSSSECSGNHIIEVDALPTENIDEGAVYECEGSYHKYSNIPFSDVIQNSGGTAVSFSEIGDAQDWTYSFNTIPTKTAENIKTTDYETVWHWYYIQDENDVFVYGADGWLSCADMDMGAFGGFVNDASEATASGYYYAVGFTGWINYIVPSGIFEITKAGTYNVTDKANVTVDCPSEAIVGVWKFNTYRPDGDSLLYIDLPVGEEYNCVLEVNSSCIFNGETKNITKIEYEYIQRFGDTNLYFYDADGNSFVSAQGVGEGSTCYDAGGYVFFDTTSLIIDFGSAPQVVPEAFKNLMTMIATPIYTIVQSE